MAASESLPPSQVTTKMMIIVMVMAMILEMMKIMVNVKMVKMMMMVMHKTKLSFPSLLASLLKRDARKVAKL